jgi:bacterial/archaeal transporter family protein
MPAGLEELMPKSPAILALLCARFWGLAPIFEKVGLRHLPPLPGVFARSLVVTAITGFALAGLFLFQRESLGEIKLNLRWFLWIAAGGISGGLLAQFLYYAALKSGEASRVAPIASAFPLVTVIFSVLFLGESITGAKALGAGLVVVGIWLLR